MTEHHSENSPFPLASQPRKPASSHLHINLDAVAHNWHLLDKQSPPSCKTGAVVKANAYGLGMEAVSHRLYDEGCRIFFTARLDEAHQLFDSFTAAQRDASQIVIFDGILDEDITAFDHKCFVPVLNDKEQLERAQNLAKNRALTSDDGSFLVWLHIDTAMARLGLSLNDWQQVKDQIDNSAPLQIETIMSHLACADDRSAALNQQQLARFKTCLEGTNTKASFANSGGVFLGHDYHFDITRPGISLYGLSPDGGDKGLKSCFSWTAQILQIREVDAGTSVGYGATFIADRQMKLATIGAGYADGLLRQYKAHMNITLAGHHCPVIGRISMDSCVIDVSHIPDQILSTTNMVHLLDKSMAAHDLAISTDTISYEIMTMLGERVQRLYDSAH